MINDYVDSLSPLGYDLMTVVFHGVLPEVIKYTGTTIFSMYCWFESRDGVMNSRSFWSNFRILEIPLLWC